MKKEFDELLEELDNILNNFENKENKEIDLKETFDKMVNEAKQKSCKIVISKEEGDTVNLGFEGGRLTLLLVLAGAEKRILNQLDCDEKEFNYIKNIVGATSIN